MKQTLNLIKGDSVGADTDYRDALPVNMTAVLKPILGAAGYMMQSPGLTQYATGLGVDRGGLWNERQESHYRVSGTNIISVGAAGSTTDLGVVGGSDTVSLPYSFNTQAVITNGKMFLYDSSAGLREVTDTDLGDPIDGIWVDGYYFLTDGEFIYHTDISDESSIDPLKFATAEFMPDKSLGLGKTQDNKVIVFGRYTTEYFVNDASENFAFSRVQTRAVKIGIVGTHAKTEMGDKWYLLGGRKDEAVSVHVLGVGAAQRVATREIDKIIGQYTEAQLAGAVVESRSEDGYSFLIIHLPNETLQFNETVSKAAGIEQAWTIVKSDTTGDLPWRAKHGLFDPRKGVWVYGDKRDATIGVLDESVSTHYGDMVEWVLDTPFTYIEAMSINELDVETVPGFTTEDDATVFVSLTYNGVTHGTEFIELYGEPSDYSKRFIVRRLGYVNAWFSFRLRGVSRSRMAFARAVFDYG